ncbi:HAD family hydrolase [Phenylobacterium sp.]|uniref:HAD-IIIC family phosphatase n=1 Tax=Phenylobacterium sp. TaxID=1871053 RepID=UPI0025EE6E92|nr:HAD-IIIC family phosphatase [Phenylobacterium sp.]
MTEPGADPRAAIDAAIAAGDLAAARRLAAAYWRDHVNASAARYLLGRLDSLWPAGAVREHRVAILRSFTVEPVVPLLQAEAALAGIRIAPWVGEFNAYGQEILDPGSGLYAHRPDSIIVAVQTRDISPDLWAGFASLTEADVAEEIEAAAARLGDLLSALRARTTANLLVHGLEPPLDPDEGLLGQQRSLTQAEAIAAVNRRLRQQVATLGDAVLVDIDALQARHGRARFRAEKKWATAKLPLSIEALAWLAADWWRHLSLFAAPQAKVLALDLDNTLWGGVVGEDGLTGIALGDEHPGVYFRTLQKAILDVARRGVLIALVSKNNLDDAMQVFDEHPAMLLRRDHLAAWRINWEPKAGNLVDLAAELNLGLESFVFLDDNPAEREAVRRSLPQVIVPDLGPDPSTYADVVRGLPMLERLKTSAEDAERTRYYAEERQRRDLRSGAESLEDFLASLDIAVAVSPIDAMSLARAAQLTQKTNQLNMTTRRYSEAQLSELLSRPGWAGYVLRARDRFGDNGIVGVALTQAEAGACEIDTFLLSCRVIGRRIETAFLADLAERARAAGLAELRGWYLPTAKNPPARAIYEDAGLSMVRKDGAAELWSIDLSAGGPRTPAWIRTSAGDLESQA